MRRAALLLIFLGALGVGTYWGVRSILHRRPRTPEEEVRFALRQLKEATEALDVERALSFVSHDYKDDQGNTFRTLRRLALRAKEEIAYLSIFTSPWEVEVKGKEAVARSTVSYYALSHNGESDSDTFKVTVYLRREGRRWKVYSSEGLPSAEGL